MGGPKIFPSLQTVPWSEELWFEGECLFFVDLSFQRGWGHIDETFGIGKYCLAERGVSQVQQWAVLNLGPVTFALCPCPYLCICLYVDCWILPGTGMVDCVLDYILAGGKLPRLMESLVSCNFFSFSSLEKSIGRLSSVLLSNLTLSFPANKQLRL